jgi:hypothetical protein
MMEINPKSIFGRHSYSNEQLLLRNFIKEVDSAITLVEPLSVGMPELILKLPRDFKIKKIKGHIGKAKTILEEIGV